MIEWNKQGAAVVGEVAFSNGGLGTVVLVASRDNPKGATVIIPGDNPEKPDMKPFAEVAAELPPRVIIDVMVMQERIFGSAGLSAPPDLTQGG